MSSLLLEAAVYEFGSVTGSSRSHCRHSLDYLRTTAKAEDLSVSSRLERLLHFVSHDNPDRDTYGTVHAEADIAAFKLTQLRLAPNA